MANLSNLNKLPNTRVFVAAENGSVEVLELVALFLLKTGTFSAKNWWEISVDVIVLCWDFLRKEKGKYTVTLINRSYLIFPRIQHKVVLLVLRSVFAVCFWLLNFLQLKLWARIPLQIGDGSSAVVLYLCFNFHNIIVLLLHFKVTRPGFFGGYHPTLKLSGIPTFTFIVSLTHRMDNI